MKNTSLVILFFLVAIFFTFGGFEMVFVLPLNIIYTAIFLVLINKVRSITGTFPVKSAWLVFVSTLFSVRALIPVASDAPKGEYWLSLLFLGKSPVTYYETLLVPVFVFLIVYNLLFFILWFKSGARTASLFSQFLGVVLIVSHLLPFTSILPDKERDQMEEEHARFSQFVSQLQTAPVVYAEPVDLGFGIPANGVEYGNSSELLNKTLKAPLSNKEKTLGRVSKFTSNESGDEFLRFTQFVNKQVPENYLLIVRLNGHIEKVELRTKPPLNSGYVIDDIFGFTVIDGEFHFSIHSRVKGAPQLIYKFEGVF